jgi:hypothetical protein
MQVLLWSAALLLFTAAIALAIIAWRTARGERVRELARIELLKTLAFPNGPEAAASGPSISNWTPSFLSEEEEEETPLVADTFEPAPPIFGERENAVAAVPRWWIFVVGIGAVIAALVGAVSARLAVSPAASSAAVPAALAAVAPDNPIELVELQSRFERGTGFNVTGLVRNPADGHELSQLMAVVELFDANGRMLTSGTTKLERPALEAGQTSAFSLLFPHVSGTVASYKVRFRLASGDPIPHVDRRVLQPAAKPPSS